MTTITARIPERSERSRTGKVFNYRAWTAIFERDGAGQWRHEGREVREAEVVEICRRASNWREIKVAHFPMVDFHA